MLIGHMHPERILVLVYLLTLRTLILDPQIEVEIPEMDLDLPVVAERAAAQQTGHSVFCLACVGWDQLFYWIWKQGFLGHCSQIGFIFLGWDPMQIPFSVQEFQNSWLYHIFLACIYNEQVFLRVGKIQSNLDFTYLGFTINLKFTLKTMITTFKVT